MPNFLKEVVAISIPSEEKIEYKKITGTCYTRNQFRHYVLEPLLLFAGKDDKGRVQKPELDENSKYTYDKMLVDIDKEIKKFPASGIISADNVKSVIKILEKFDGKGCSNKKNFVDVMWYALDTLEKNIENTISYTKMSKRQWEKTRTRDIVCYMQSMVDNDDIPQFKSTLARAAEALSKKPESEIKQESGGPFITKYYKPKKSILSKIFKKNKKN